jgi:beta-galactosidase
MDKQQINLLENWRFHLGDIEEAWSKTYEETDWKTISVPHDWSIEQPFSTEYSSGTGYVAGGIGWYRCSFFLDEKYRGKQISIVFDGVYKNSQVWCNSYYKGSWPYGYTTFRHDITKDACFGEEENLICVKVSHTDIADSRWFTGSGITRKVTLLIEEEVHPSFDGIFFQTPDVSKEHANLLIKNHIVNSSDVDKNVTVKNILKDINNIETLSILTDCIIKGKASHVFENKGILLNPYLWSTNTPYLYTLETFIKYDNKDQAGNDNWYLADSKKVGIRSFTFDPDKGFTLNGISQKLKGVCVHHDAGCLGAAVTPFVWARRLLKLKEMGCNAIRMSHNPHMPELYDLCDSLGFLVMDEAFDEWEGVKNKWSTGHNVYPPKHQGYYETFPEWHEKDLVSLIRRDRNHPSIIMWSVGNEIDYPNDPYCHPLFQTMTGNNDKDKPAAERQYNPNKPNALRLVSIAKDLTEIVKREDNSRPVTLASAFPELSATLGLYDNLDVIGYNYKEHLYEDDHKRFTKQPILGSENGHGYKEWLAVTTHDYISGQFLWTGIDYLGEAHGWPIHGSSAGLLTLAGFEKPAYYRRKGLWSDSPCIHLATTHYESDNHEFTPVYESWNYRIGEQVEVRCYTNLNHAELFLNNESLGSNKINKETGYISWVIPFTEGHLKVVGLTNQDTMDTTIEASLITTLSPCKIHLEEFKLPLTDTKLKAFSVENLHQIELTIEDQNANRVVTDSSMLFVTPQENAILLGIENGDLSDVTSYTEAYRRAYDGRLLIYVKKENPNLPAKIKVNGHHLKDEILEF